MRDQLLKGWGMAHTELYGYEERNYKSASSNCVVHQYDHTYTYNAHLLVCCV